MEGLLVKKSQHENGKKVEEVPRAKTGNRVR
jgi:hypothetical protein